MTDRDQLAALPTPSLVLDEARMMRNIDRLRGHLVVRFRVTDKHHAAIGSS